MCYYSSMGLVRSIGETRNESKEQIENPHGPTTTTITTSRFNIISKSPKFRRPPLETIPLRRWTLVHGRG